MSCQTVISFPEDDMGVAAAPYSICDHLHELVEAELAVSVLVGFHDSFIHDLLQLRVLSTGSLVQVQSWNSRTEMNEP